MKPDMTPIDWAKRPLEKYSDFSGRAPRAEYWYYVLAIIIAFAVIKIIESIVGIGGMVLGVYGPLTILLWLATIVPSLAVSIRRLHDTDRSGWWLLLPIVAYCIAFALGGRDLMSGQITELGIAGIFLLIGVVGWIVLFIFYVLSGTPGDNRYGPNPYAAGGG
jgi:uncharacterized membrane protein YhaH (DUF805 family)